MTEKNKDNQNKKIAIFDAHHFERSPLNNANAKYGYQITFFEARLTPETVSMAQGFDVVCSFANDRVNAEVIQQLQAFGIKLIALRSAGFNHVDLAAAKKANISVVRVPAYSPYAIAEHAVGLILALNRKIHRAYNRTRELNFSLDGLVGFDLHGKTVGVIGAGRIGSIFCKIMSGFGCQVMVYDLNPPEELKKNSQIQFVDLETLYKSAQIISLHVPLNPQTKHILDQKAFSMMRPGVMVINTGRGALIETHALIQNLKTGQIGSAGLDVYEEEENFFFQDLSGKVLQDDDLARLLTFPNVLVTSHQGFLTFEALTNIADTTFMNINQFFQNEQLVNQIQI